jgi:hypothetical protein
MSLFERDEGQAQGLKIRDFGARYFIGKVYFTAKCYETEALADKSSAGM